MSQFVFVLASISVALNAGARIALRKTMRGVAVLPSSAGERIRFVRRLHPEQFGIADCDILVDTPSTQAELNCEPSIDDIAAMSAAYDAFVGGSVVAVAPP